MERSDGGMSLIVRTITDLALVFILTFGIYLVVHGYLTPGGGFQGGVVIASAAVLALVAYGHIFAQKEGKKYRTYSTFEALGGIAFIIVAALGLGTAYFYNYFWRHHLAFGGKPGTLWSSGMVPLMNLAVGIKVATGFAAVLALFFIYTHLHRKRGEAE